MPAFTRFRPPSRLIDERPDDVARRIRIGDWDLIAVVVD